MADITAKTTDKTTQAPAAQQTSQQKAAPGLKFSRYFTRAGVSPYNEVEWEKRTASITDAKGNSIFEQKDVESPKDWSMTAINIVASKYLHGQIGTPQQNYPFINGQVLTPPTPYDAGPNIGQGFPAPPTPQQRPGAPAGHIIPQGGGGPGPGPQRRGAGDRRSAPTPPSP